MHEGWNSELNPDIKRNKRPLHVLRASYFNIFNQTMLISRQNGKRTQIDAVSQLHDRWNGIVSKTLPLSQCFQIDPVSPKLSIGVRMRLQIKWNRVRVQVNCLGESLNDVWPYRYR